MRAHRAAARRSRPQRCARTSCTRIRRCSTRSRRCASAAARHSGRLRGARVLGRRRRRSRHDARGQPALSADAVLETYALRRADHVFDDLRGLARRHRRARHPASEGHGDSECGRHRAFALERAGPTTVLKRSSGSTGMPVIGFIGSFYAYEGLDLLLDALPAIVARTPGRARAARRRRAAGEPR